MPSEELNEEAWPLQAPVKSGLKIRDLRRVY